MRRSRLVVSAWCAFVALSVAWTFRRNSSARTEDIRVSLNLAVQHASTSWLVHVHNATPGVPVQRPLQAPWPDRLWQLVIASTVGSLDPPKVPEDDAGLLEYHSRLVVGLAAAVHSGGVDVATGGAASLDVVKVMFASFFSTASPGYIYRIYLAFDADDPVYRQQQWRQAVANELWQGLVRADSQLWHPASYTLGTVDPSALLVSLHWVRCNYAGKPAWAQNDAAMAAFKEGADYVFRTNDDTHFPAQPDWLSILIRQLRSMRPVTNLGVVGPAGSDRTDILTHDFTHRTHVLIHGFYYPREFTDWFGDNWISWVYRPFNMTVIRRDVVVKHTLRPARYRATIVETVQKHLWDNYIDKEVWPIVWQGQARVAAFAREHFNVSLRNATA